MSGISPLPCPYDGTDTADACLSPEASGWLRQPRLVSELRRRVHRHEDSAVHELQQDAAVVELDARQRLRHRCDVSRVWPASPRGGCVRRGGRARVRYGVPAVRSRRRYATGILPGRCGAPARLPGPQELTQTALARITQTHTGALGGAPATAADRRAGPARRVLPTGIGIRVRPIVAPVIAFARPDRGCDGGTKDDRSKDSKFHRLILVRSASCTRRRPEIAGDGADGAAGELRRVNEAYYCGKRTLTYG